MFWVIMSLRWQISLGNVQKSTVNCPTVTHNHPGVIYTVFRHSKNLKMHIRNSRVLKQVARIFPEQPIWEVCWREAPSGEHLLYDCRQLKAPKGQKLTLFVVYSTANKMQYFTVSVPSNALLPNMNTVVICSTYLSKCRVWMDLVSETFTFSRNWVILKNLQLHSISKCFSQPLTSSNAEGKQNRTNATLAVALLMKPILV